MFVALIGSREGLRQHIGRNVPTCDLQGHQITAIAVLTRDPEQCHRTGGHQSAHEVGCLLPRHALGGAERMVNLWRVIAKEADFVQHAVAGEVQGVAVDHMGDLAGLGLRGGGLDARGQEKGKETEYQIAHRIPQIPRGKRCRQGKGDHGEEGAEVGFLGIVLGRLVRLTAETTNAGGQHGNSRKPREFS